MNDFLSPTAKAKAFSRLREFLKGHDFERRFSKEERALFDVELTHLERSQFRTVLFRHLRTTGKHDYFEIGYHGEPLRIVKTSLRGVWAVWWALHNGSSGSDALRASDLVDPDAGEPEQSARRMIRKTAAAQFACWGLPELELAAKLCTVSNTGLIRCERPVASAKVITR